MISAEIGGRVKVTGSSIAMVATGPMPGSTPISVPSSTPTKQYIRFWQGQRDAEADAEVVKQSEIHTYSPGQRLKGKPSPLTNTKHPEQHQHYGQDHDFLLAEIMAAQGAQHDQYHRRQHQTQWFERIAEDHYRNQDHEHRLRPERADEQRQREAGERKLEHRRALKPAIGEIDRDAKRECRDQQRPAKREHLERMRDFRHKCTEHHDDAKERQQAAQHGGKIRGPHAQPPSPSDS